MNFKLSYVDFPPRCLGTGVICSPDYERFDMLIQRANEWLRRNGNLKVRTCESIEVKGRYDGHVDTDKSSYFEADDAKRKMRNMYIRALRLWVSPKSPDEPPEAQQIGYINVVPRKNEAAMFDSFGSTVRKLNMHLREQPIRGRIINVESQEMKFHEWGVGVDPDESCWVESVKFNISFLVVVRVFFAIGPPAYEEIGCADFVPTCADHGSQLRAASFETFGQVVDKARAWVAGQARVRVTNVQSIDYKLTNEWDGSNLNTQRSFFVESGRLTTRYLRIIRICFVRTFLESLPPAAHAPVVCLNYVTFEPRQVSNGGIIGIPVFESLGDTMRRAMAWLNRNPVRVLGAETVPIRMFSGNQYGNHEITHTWNRGEQKEFWLLVIRIFLDGDYTEPPDNVIKRAQDDGRKSCCDCNIL